MIVNAQHGSTSSLQRRFKIGYSRAGRIMDMLEEKGIVGPQNGSKPREVLVDALELEGIKALENYDQQTQNEEVALPINNDYDKADCKNDDCDNKDNTDKDDNEEKNTDIKEHDKSAKEKAENFNNELIEEDIDEDAFVDESHDNNNDDANFDSDQLMEEDIE